MLEHTDAATEAVLTLAAPTATLAAATSHWEYHNHPTAFGVPAPAELPRFVNVDEVVDELRPSEPIFCIRTAELHRMAGRFRSGFPGRTLFAVKCNPHPLVLQTLFDAGIRDFDVASLEEIQLVDKLFGKAAGIYFNNPLKSRTALRIASENHQVRFYTIDHASELEKISDEARRDDDLIIAVRLATKSRGARYALSTKFGAPPDVAAKLLNAVHRAGFRAGLSFHVGSQCLAPDAFTTALTTCGQVIRDAGVPVSMLNVGGGFPAPYPRDEVAALEHYFAAIILGLRQLRLPAGCIMLSEPGRSLVATAGSVVTQVLLRRDRDLYINDGIFGNLQELGNSKEHRPVRLIRPRNPPSGNSSGFRVYGPTCNSNDVLGAPFVLPSDVREGDWLEIGMMGAYSLALRTRFNGFLGQTVVAIGE